MAPHVTAASIGILSFGVARRGALAGVASPTVVAPTLLIGENGLHGNAQKSEKGNGRDDLQG